MQVDPNKIQNILTLRYDPSQNSSLYPITAKNFSSKINDYSINKIEKIIENYILEKFQNSNTKKVSLALSGGVDSTLVLAFLKKTLPDLEINAISIKFAESTDETKTAEKIAKHFDVNHHILLD